MCYEDIVIHKYSPSRKSNNFTLAKNNTNKNLWLFSKEKFISKDFFSFLFSANCAIYPLCSDTSLICPPPHHTSLFCFFFQGRRTTTSSTTSCPFFPPTDLLPNIPRFHLVSVRSPKLPVPNDPECQTRMWKFQVWIPPWLQFLLHCFFPLKQAFGMRLISKFQMKHTHRKQYLPSGQQFVEKHNTSLWYVEDSYFGRNWRCTRVT